MIPMKLGKMLTQIVSAIRLLTTDWTFEALLFPVLGPDVTGEIVWSGCPSKILEAVFKRAMLDSRSVRTGRRTLGSSARDVSTTKELEEEQICLRSTYRRFAAKSGTSGEECVGWSGECFFGFSFVNEAGEDISSDRLRSPNPEFAHSPSPLCLLLTYGMEYSSAS